MRQLPAKWGCKMIGDTWIVEEVKSKKKLGCDICKDCCFSVRNRPCYENCNCNTTHIYTKRKVKHFDLTDEDIDILKIGQAWHYGLIDKEILNAPREQAYKFFAALMFYYEVTGQCKVGRK